MKVPVVVTLTMMATFAINVYGCPAGEFDCGNGECIQASLRCDGTKLSCSNGADEVGCKGTCFDEKFHCGDNDQKCIDADWRCDGESDCTTDELDCGSLCDGTAYQDAAPRFNCTASRTCALKCNGKNDCPGSDKSDEEDCKGECYDKKFHCGVNAPKCVDKSDRCDGYKDCSTDEFGCGDMCNGTASKGGPFLGTCTSNGQCASRCNGRVNCPGSDGSDEIGCNGECADGRFHCGSRGPQCIPKNKVCDGFIECYKSVHDELNCGERCAGTLYPGGPEKLICADNKMCVRRCDGWDFCDDGSDEEGCNATCYDGRIHCGDDHALCIRSTLRCNGDRNCRDGRDEMGCGAKCSGTASPGGPELYNCTDGSCGRKCDAHIECHDGGDEDPILCKNRCWNGSYHCGLQNLGCRSNKTRCNLDQTPRKFM